MTDSAENARIDGLLDKFDLMKLSPDGWPVRVIAAVAAPQTFAQWPDFPAAATLHRARLGHGAAADHAAARRSAVGELIEIASCAVWPDTPTIRMPAARARADGAWMPDLLNGFSRSQAEDRDRWNARMDGIDWIAPDAAPDGPIDWVAATAPDGARVLVPADFAVIGRREQGDSRAVCVADTNGCAAGPTPAAARLSALCELIERDATGRWWYGRRQAPVLAAETAGAKAAARFLAGRDRRLWLLDITSDIGVPSIAALAMSRDGRHMAAGFATRPRRAGAIAAALAEMMMMELKVAMARAGPAGGPDLARWFDEIDFGADEPFAGGPGTGGLPVRDLADEGDVLRALTAAGVRVAFIDATRPEFAIPAVRAVSPDLCHWKPRLGRARIARGLSGAPLNDRLLCI